MERRQHRVAVGGTAVSVTSVGTGRPLILLHPEPDAALRPIVDRLAAAHTVTVPQLPGFTAPPFGRETSAELAALAAGVVAALAPDGCDVWGHDSGAAIALWLALERPAGVSHLILTAPADRDVADGFSPALLDRAGAVQQPTMIVQGTADAVVPEDNARELRKRLPHGYLTYVFEGGHALDVDEPDRLYAIAGEFLERSEAFIVNWGSLAL